MSRIDFEDGVALLQPPLEALDEKASLLGNGGYSQSMNLQASFRP
jgi:hypothetical protein